MQSGNPYSVLKCKPIQGVPWRYGVSLFHSHGVITDSKASPHYHIIGSVEDGTEYTIVINIESRDNSSPMLLYFIDFDFKHEITTRLVDKMREYQILQPVCAPAGLALDYVRSGLFDPSRMILENTTPDGQDSLNKVIDDLVQKTITERADIYAFGKEYFDAQKGNGVHDIHMNQGNGPRYAGEDGVYQDGGLFFHFPATDHWIAMFLAFQSQSFHTNPRTGHRLDSSYINAHR